MALGSWSSQASQEKSSPGPCSASTASCRPLAPSQHPAACPVPVVPLCSPKALRRRVYMPGQLPPCLSRTCTRCEPTPLCQGIFCLSAEPSSVSKDSARWSGNRSLMGLGVRCTLPAVDTKVRTGLLCHPVPPVPHPTASPLAADDAGCCGQGGCTSPYDSLAGAPWAQTRSTEEGVSAARAQL